jgi:hypothetical protein
VPVVGRVSESRNPVPVLQRPVDPKDELSGFRMLTTTALQPVYVEPETLMLTCWPTVPLNVYFAFWPTEVVVTVNGVPGVIVPVTSAKLLSKTVALPTPVPAGLISTV